MKTEKCPLSRTVSKQLRNLKLLGVTIDNKLNFTKHVSNIRTCIFRKLYSIKRLFNLCTSVKLQFYKTFIMPYFDYCSSIMCYFPKTAIRNISRCFEYSLIRLFKIKSETDNKNDYNNLLEKYGLNNLEHRVIIRLSSFIHKSSIMKKDQSNSKMKWK